MNQTETPQPSDAQAATLTDWEINDIERMIRAGSINGWFAPTVLRLIAALRAERRRREQGDVLLAIHGRYISREKAAALLDMTYREIALLECEAAERGYAAYQAAGEPQPTEAIYGKDVTP